MATFPERVIVSEENIAKLTDLYRTAYKQIIDELATATNFGVANRKAILAQIRLILQDLGVEAEGEINPAIRLYYKLGADDAVKQLTAVGAEIGVREGFNRIHEGAITALIDETSKSFADSIQGVNRSVTKLLSQAVKEQLTQQLALGKITGKTLKQIQRNLVGTLQADGLDALIDKAGRGWTLDRYTEMLIRTKAVEARNTGMVNRLVENDYDLVQVSSHGAIDQCGKWEGRILSVTGQTKSYPTVQEAQEDGLLHPNCKHALNVIVPELASVTHAYDPSIDTMTYSELSKLQL